MNRAQLIKRRDYLMNIHCWCFETNNFIISELQLICVTAECVSIMHAMEQLQYDSDRSVCLDYTIPNKIEQKCNQILQIINDTNWTRGEYVYNELERKFERKSELWMP